jgi:hypothetical protein
MRPPVAGFSIVSDRTDAVTGTLWHRHALRVGAFRMLREVVCVREEVLTVGVLCALCV